MTQVDQLHQQQLASLATLYENRLQDIITTIKNAASYSNHLSSVQQADTIKNALITQREAQIYRLLYENAGVKAEAIKLYGKVSQYEAQLSEREQKYYRVKQLYKAARETQDSARNQISRFEEQKQKSQQLKIEVKQLRAELQKAQENAPENVYKCKAQAELKLQQMEFEYEGKLYKQRLALERKISYQQSEIYILRYQNEQLQAVHGPYQQGILSYQIQQLYYEVYAYKEKHFAKDEQITQLQEALRKYKQRKYQKDQNLAVYALNYYNMANSLYYVKKELQQLRQQVESPFLLQNEEISALLTVLFKYLNYSDLKQLIALNVAAYVKQREDELKREWGEAIYEVENCVSEMK